MQRPKRDAGHGRPWTIATTSTSLPSTHRGCSGTNAKVETTGTATSNTMVANAARRDLAAAQWQELVPESVKVRPASGTNRQL
jgi:hypothetical protein